MSGLVLTEENFETLLKPKIPLWAHQKKAVLLASKQSQFGLFFEVGCLAHDTEIKVSRGLSSRTYTIEKLFRLFNRKELSWNERGFSKRSKSYCRSFKKTHIGLHEITHVIRSGEKELYKLSWKSSGYIKLTLDHKVLTKRGFIPVSKIRVGEDFIATDDTKKHQSKKEKSKRVKPYYPKRKVGDFHPYARIHRNHHKQTKIIEHHRIVFEANLNNIDLDTFIKRTYSKNKMKFIDPTKFHIHHLDHNTRNNHISNLVKLTPTEHQKIHGKENHRNFAHGRIMWRKITSIKHVGKGMTYDISCADPHHNFVANDAVIHNCGKTATAIHTLRCRYLSNKRLLRTLVLGPPIILENWKKEFLLHSNIKPHDISVVYGSGKERIKIVSDKCFDESGNPIGHICITNYESLYMDDLFAILKKWEPEAIVFDEIHKLKEMKAKRTKRSVALATTSKYRLGLTGTPVLNSPMDLFSQFKCLDLGSTFGSNFFVFRAHYFYDKNSGMPSQKYFPDWRIKPGALEDISEKIKAITMHIKKEECLDLPPLVRKIYTVELTPEQRKHYDAMKKSFITYVNDKACVATMALTKALRLQQMASGFMKLEDGTELRNKTNPRKTLLKELLEEIAPNHKVLIWACFKENYEQIREVCDELKLSFVEVHGEVSGQDRFKAVDAFNEDQKIRVLIGHPGSGGIGINLIAASYSIFYSRSFSLEHDIQAEGRNYRGGSNIHSKITRIDIVAKDTIDEIVQQSLATKEDISKRILGEYRTDQDNRNVPHNFGGSGNYSYAGKP